MFPEADDVIDLAFVKEDVVLVFWEEEGLFIPCEHDGGVHAGYRGSHGCSVELEPVGVTKFEDVVIHNEV